MSGVSVASVAPLRPGRAPGAVQRPVVSAAAIAMALLAVAIAGTAGATMVALFGIGLTLGASLYHASFGFTSAFRLFLADGQGAGLRAQIVMLALACLLFFPALGMGHLFGAPVRGNVEPVGVALVVGAFLFGLGMQLGGGCASGTLYAVGGGSARMMLTLAFFVVGSVVGTAQVPLWAAMPGLAGVSLIQSFGWPTALLANFAVFAGLWLAVAAVERRRHGALEAIARPGHIFRGPWPLAGGAVVLAVLNFATLALAGRPWGITSAFGLWGGKLLGAAGIDVSGWGGWTAPALEAALERPLLSDITSVMDFGIMLGALLAAGLAGRCVAPRRIPARQVAASVIGGLLLGYGARLAYGCNIGAFFSGVASGSLHGWVWLACALAGSYLGLRLRPLFGMAVERRPTSC